MPCPALGLSRFCTWFCISGFPGFTLFFGACQDLSANSLQLHAQTCHSACTSWAVDNLGQMAGLPAVIIIFALLLSPSTRVRMKYQHARATSLQNEVEPILSASSQKDFEDTTGIDYLLKCVGLGSCLTKELSSIPWKLSISDSISLKIMSVCPVVSFALNCRHCSLQHSASVRLNKAF